MRQAKVTVMVRKYTPGARDSHGNVQPSWGPGQERKVYACAPSLDPETFQVSRDQDGGIRWDVYAPVGTDIEANDRVEFNGQLLDVDGPPTPWFAISDSKPVGQVHNLIWKEAIDG